MSDNFFASVSTYVVRFYISYVYGFPYGHVFQFVTNFLQIIAFFRNKTNFKKIIKIKILICQILFAQNDPFIATGRQNHCTVYMYVRRYSAVILFLGIWHCAGK